MQRLLMAIVVITTLCGCASTHTNPLSKVSNLSEKNLGEVVALIYSNNRDKSEVKLDETEKLWHWKTTLGLISPSYTSNDDSTDERLKYFESYCSSLKGIIDGPKESVKIMDWKGKEILCTDAKTKHPIFRVIGSYYTKTLGQVPQKITLGACAWLSRGKPGYDMSLQGYGVAQQLVCYHMIDAFQWKTFGTPDDVDREYKLGLLGFDTDQAVNAVKADREEAAKQEMIAEEERIRKIREQADQMHRESQKWEQLEHERVMRDLPKIKTVGQKICRAKAITQHKVMGYFRGDPIYENTESTVLAMITAFTENSSDSKIQIRISGIQANGSNVDRIDGDVVLQNGAVIWDEAENWKLCY